MSDGFFSHCENPVGLQPLGRHPEIGREVRRRLILGNRAEHVALLALQQLEQRLPAASLVADAFDDLGASGTDRSCSRSAPK